MACILHIETATTVCSVALSREGTVLFEKASFEGATHAALLGVYVSEAIKEMKADKLTLDAVAVSSGPGSYTGLRIGVSEAKGICFGYDIPLISTPTLDILASKAIRLNENASDRLYCAMLDARRMEVYAAIYDAGLQVRRETRAEIVDNTTYADWLAQGKVCFFGSGAGKCMEVIHSDNALFLENLHPLATDMVALAEKAYARQEFVDTAYFEPFYLKEFVATVAKNKVLG